MFQLYCSLHGNDCSDTGDNLYHCYQGSTDRSVMVRGSLIVITCTFTYIFTKVLKYIQVLKQLLNIFLIRRPGTDGDVAQWQSVRFACERPGVQSPASPKIFIFNFYQIYRLKSNVLKYFMTEQYEIYDLKSTKHFSDRNEKDWRCGGLNPGPFTCKANALPLSYIPVDYCHRLPSQF